MAKSLLSLDKTQPQVMAVVNITPDSFSDGGSFYRGPSIDLDACLRRVDQVIAEGATIVDIGGESTRPGAAPVSITQELDRVLPLLEAIKDYPVVLSIDTSTPQVMQEAAKLGAGLINDIRALQREGALYAAAAAQIPVCLMHMQGKPETMQQGPQYDDVISEVSDFFQQRIRACVAAGIAKQQILLDPGFGFGKTLMHNRQLLQHLDGFSCFGLPLLVGLSRKRMIGEILDGRAVDQRMIGSVALAMIAVQNGAWIIRAHDIKETVDAVRIAQFMQKE